MEFAGDFETHITVQCLEGAGVEPIRIWGEERNLKFHHILLDRGQFASQPMLTRFGRGRLSDELAAAEGTGRDLNLVGFAVLRVKIEAAPWNDGVPRTSEDAAAQPGDRYFEHHIKLLLPADANLLALCELADAHSAHLSRNARRFRDDGLCERFVTQRCRSAGRIEAGEQLDTLLREIRSACHPILEIEEEYVVYDSNLAIDAGWILPGA